MSALATEVKVSRQTGLPLPVARVPVSVAGKPISPNHNPTGELPESSPRSERQRYDETQKSTDRPISIIDIRAETEDKKLIFLAENRPDRKISAATGDFYIPTSDEQFIGTTINDDDPKAQTKREQARKFFLNATKRFEEWTGSKNVNLHPYTGIVRALADVSALSFYHERHFFSLVRFR